MDTTTVADSDTRYSSKQQGSTLLSVSHVVIHLMLCALVTAGNVITLLCFITPRTLRQRKYVIICSLAVSDLMVGVVNTWIASWLGQAYTSGECLPYRPVYLAVYTNGSAYIVSALHAMAIGLDRFVAVMLPFRYPSLIANKVIVVVVTLIWSIPAFSLSFLISDNSANTEAACANLTVSKSSCVVFVLSYILILLLLCKLYGKNMPHCTPAKADDPRSATRAKSTRRWKNGAEKCKN